MSKLKTNTIQHTGGSADNLTLDNSQNVTIEGKAGVGVTASEKLHVDKGAPGGSNAIIARFQAESSRRLDVVWHDSGSYMGFDTPSTHDIVFKRGGNERARVNDNGLAFPSGKGIDFSATGDGTGGTNVSELLDDYEEGNFTPTSGGWSALGTASYTARHGRYVKIGSQVTVHGYVNWSSISGASGVHAIGGFPFAHSSSTYAGACWTHPENMGDARVSGLFGDGYGSGILLYVPNSGGQGYVSADTNGGIIRFTCIYHTDA